MRDEPPRERPLPDPERVLARQPWASLRPLLQAAECDVERALDALRHYALSLLQWNRGVSNLISRHDEARLIERHLAESLRAAALIRESGCARLVDLGSGAGLPAIPLAIAGVGEHWVLVESRRNKTLFMRKALLDLKMDNIEVMTARLEVAVEESADTLACDGFTARATMAVGPTLELAARIVRPGGRAFLWKGSSFADEMRSTERSWVPSWTFESEHPISDGPNTLAIFIRK